MEYAGIVLIAWRTVALVVGMWMSRYGQVAFPIVGGSEFDWRVYEWWGGGVRSFLRDEHVAEVFDVLSP